MRKMLIALGMTLCVGLAATPGLRAGVYNTAEPAIWPMPGSLQDFQYRLGELRSIAVEMPKDPKETRETLREYYLRRVAELEAKERTDGLSVEDRINLGAYFIRLLKYEEAVRVLTPAESKDPGNFMVLANLSTASAGAGRLERAIAYLQQALTAWPHVHFGYTAAQLYFYRTAERYQLRLLQLRQQESRLQPGRPPETVDALFGRVRFAGANGKYEPGGIALEQLDELPVESVPVVTQLVFWLPFDDRLYWLLAELLNAQGEPEKALTLMKDLSYGRRFSTPEFMEHRRVLLEQEEAMKQFMDPKSSAMTKEQLLGVMLPRGVGLAPGADALLQEAGWLGVFQHFDARSKIDSPLTDDGKQPPPGRNGDDTSGKGLTAPPAFWRPDVRHLVVSFLAGVAVTMLLVLQVRANRARGKTTGG
jgi:tetratricopeptide (TPR) repeat protein